MLSIIDISGSLAREEIQRMKVIQQTLRRDSSKWHLVSTNIPNVAAAFNTDSMLPAITEIVNMCLGHSKAVVGDLRRRCGCTKMAFSVDFAEMSNGLNSAENHVSPV
jgi:hypothetical protein